jgi:hypothetical protein
MLQWNLLENISEGLSTALGGNQMVRGYWQLSDKYLLYNEEFATEWPTITNIF